jgi:hypothetical protein
MNHNYSSEMALQTSHVILTFAHLMCLFLEALRWTLAFAEFAFINFSGWKTVESVRKKDIVSSCLV